MWTILGMPRREFLLTMPLQIRNIDASRSMKPDFNGVVVPYVTVSQPMALAR
jgi:hypothetical protein